MTPPPPPPPMSEAPTLTLTTMNSALRTPPQRTRKHSTGHNQYSKSPLASPATSASSVSSPTHVSKARMRMDPYPRYSPRKRLSADYSDGTYSVGSGGDSPRSEKGGWRIHAAVAGPFLTGPLAREFRAEDFKSPRGKKINESDFDNNLGLLLFPVVPAFVPPAISPEVFQAALQPAPTPSQIQQLDATTAAPPAEPYYPPQQQQEQTHDASSYEAYSQSYQQEEYHQHFYPTEQYQQENHQYAAEQQYGEYNYGSYEQHYGYEQHYTTSAAEAYGYEPSYEAQYAPPVEQQGPFDAPLATNEEAFPPLPHVEPSSNQPVDAVVEETVPVATRERAPSYADVVSGAAHPAPPSPRKEAAAHSIFEDMTAGIAESMSSMLIKAKGSGKTHSEVEFACLIHKISTQLKLMGKVSSSLKLEQMKAVHKLQKAEAEKLSIEAANTQMAALVKQYEQERDELKQQLTEALEAKDTKLQDAVLSLTQKIDSLKNTKLASEIDAIRQCGSADDLEKRVEQIGQVLDHLIASHAKSTPASPEKAAARRPSNNTARRQSIGSWKAIALYAILVWAASLCGVWVGVKYVAQPAATVAQPVALNEADVEAILARLSAKFPAIETTPREIAEAVASLNQPVQQVEAVQPAVVEVSVSVDAEVEPVESPVIEVMSQPTSSPVTQVLYSWRPSMFDTVAEQTSDVSALSGLARALTSLSSQMMAEQPNTESSVVFEVIDEPVETAVEEQQVDDVSGSVVELADVMAEEVVAVEEIEVVAEPVVKETIQFSNVSAVVSLELTEQAPLSFSPVAELPMIEAPVVVEAAQVEVDEVVAAVEVVVPVVESVVESVVAAEWVLPAAVVEVESVKEIKFSNVSAVAVTKESVAIDGVCSLPAVVDLRSL